MRPALLGVLLTCTWSISGAVSAAPRTTAGHHELERTSAPWLLSELALSGAAAVTTLVAFREPPEHCKLCASNGFDEGVRDALRAEAPRKAGMLSDLLAVGIAPALGLGALLVPPLARGEGRHAAENAGVALTAFGLTLATLSAVKVTTARKRPAAHHGVASQSPLLTQPRERNLSFFSSHTALVFAGASSATTLGFLRGYESAPYVAAVGGGLGLTTGLLRIAADMHWATDVLVGAAVGVTFGAAVPLLLHQRARSGSLELGLSPWATADGSGMSLAGTF